MKRIGLTVLAVLGLLTVINASCLAPHPERSVQLMAHRGVHQTFSLEGVTAHSCTAEQTLPAPHGFLENTLPSIRAAFEAGADVVEVDVHRTADGHLMVFHDEMLECRTDGFGRPEDHTLAVLRGLDLGYGYTSDGGATYPLRGTGVGLVVTLPEVYAAFPGRAFIVDIKAGGEAVGDLVADTLAMLPIAERTQQFVYGSSSAVARVNERLPEVQSFNRTTMKACLKRYLLTGWTGAVPEDCQETWVFIPVNYQWLIWGFPRRFEARMESVGSSVVLMGPWDGNITTAIDDEAVLAKVPDDFNGWIWTNRVEVIAPLVLPPE